MKAIRTLVKSNDSQRTVLLTKDGNVYVLQFYLSDVEVLVYLTLIIQDGVPIDTEDKIISTRCFNRQIGFAGAEDILNIELSKDELM